MGDLDNELRGLLADVDLEMGLHPIDLHRRRIRRVLRRQGIEFAFTAVGRAIRNEVLTEDEFVLTHGGFLPDEWSENLGEIADSSLQRRWTEPMRFVNELVEFAS